MDGRSHWFEHLSPIRKPLLRLFCFPYAGGNAQVFRPWQRYFPPEVDLVLVHLPGRGRRSAEPLFRHVNLLVNAIADHFPVETEQAFAFYGHSLGAVVSFELARELRRRYGILPKRLFLSGRRAPHVPDRERPTHNLPHDEFVAELERLNGTPKELLESPETLELFLPILRADFEMAETCEYHPGERLSCPIHVYGGQQDEEVSAEDLRAWEEHTSAAFAISMFAGDHFFIHDRNTSFLDTLRGDVLRALSLPGSAPLTLKASSGNPT
jgi:medium-chain acyl-[acyl-carrier-protein] hydrolase